MTDLGRTILLVGIFLVVLGGILLLLGRAGLPIGRLPGDITVRGKHSTFYFPLMTCILLSIVLSVISWLIQHFRK